MRTTRNRILNRTRDLDNDAEDDPMPHKFNDIEPDDYNIPKSIDRNLRVVDEDYITISDTDALLQKHNTLWLRYSRIIFLTEEVKDIDDEGLKKLIDAYITDTDTEMIISQGSRYTQSSMTSRMSLETQSTGTPANKRKNTGDKVASDGNKNSMAPSYAPFSDELQVLRKITEKRVFVFLF